VLTALDDEVNTRAGFELGATDYLTKPFSIPRSRRVCVPVSRAADEDVSDPVIT
jgi:DNA-binding response OmpR family regulator